MCLKEHEQPKRFFNLNSIPLGIRQFWSSRLSIPDTERVEHMKHQYQLGEIQIFPTGPTDHRPAPTSGTTKAKMATCPFCSHRLHDFGCTRCERTMVGVSAEDIYYLYYLGVIFMPGKGLNPTLLERVRGISGQTRFLEVIDGADLPPWTNSPTKPEPLPSDPDDQMRASQQPICPRCKQIGLVPNGSQHRCPKCNWVGSDRY